MASANPPASELMKAFDEMLRLDEEEKKTGPGTNTTIIIMQLHNLGLILRC